MSGILVQTSEIECVRVTNEIIIPDIIIITDKMYSSKYD